MESFRCVTGFSSLYSLQRSGETLYISNRFFWFGTLKVGLCPLFFMPETGREENMSEFVIDKISEYAASLLPSMGLELFDVQFRQEDRGWVLRIFIDSKDGVDLNHCTEVSREISAYLEVEDLIQHAYHLEISSPGIERPLRNMDDCRRFVGRHAKIKLHHAVEGQKVYVGTLLEDKDVASAAIETEDGRVITFTMDDVNYARLHLA